MFLFERIVGISTFIISLFIVSILIAKCNNIKKTKKILIGYIFILFMMGYFYYPYKTADLSYIKNLITNSLIYKNFGEIFLIFQNKRYSMFYIYYWIFGQIGNVNLLPAVTATFFYSNIFYILYKSCQKFNLSPKTMSVTLLFFMAGGQYLEVISGIKSMFAFSIVALCCYREFIEEKSFIIHLPLYLFAALMHDAALIAVGFRLIYLLFQKENKLIIKLRNFILCGFFIFFATKYGGEIIQGATNKGQGYMSGNVYSSVWEYVVAILSDLFMIYSIFLMRKINKIDSELKAKIVKCMQFVVFLLLFDNAFIFEYSIFHRYRTFVSMLIIPVVAILFEKAKNKEYEFLKNYNSIFRIYFILTMGISLTRGNLSNLKFFDMTNW